MLFLVMRGRNKRDEDSTYNLSVKMPASSQAEERDGQIDVDKPDRKSVRFPSLFN